MPMRRKRDAHVEEERCLCREEEIHMLRRDLQVWDDFWNGCVVSHIDSVFWGNRLFFQAARAQESEKGFHHEFLKRKRFN